MQSCRSACWREKKKQQQLEPMQPLAGDPASIVRNHGWTQEMRLPRATSAGLALGLHIAHAYAYPCCSFGIGSIDRDRETHTHKNTTSKLAVTSHGLALACSALLLLQFNGTVLVFFNCSPPFLTVACFGHPFWHFCSASYREFFSSFSHLLNKIQN